mgnify:CR=1 FL=1
MQLDLYQFPRNSSIRSDCLTARRSKSCILKYATIRSYFICNYVKMAEKLKRRKKIWSCQSSLPYQHINMLTSDCITSRYNAQLLSPTLSYSISSSLALSAFPSHLEPNASSCACKSSWKVFVQDLHGHRCMRVGRGMPHTHGECLCLQSGWGYNWTIYLLSSQLQPPRSVGVVILGANSDQYRSASFHFVLHQDLSGRR